MRSREQDFRGLIILLCISVLIFAGHPCTGGEAIAGQRVTTLSTTNGPPPDTGSTNTGFITIYPDLPKRWVAEGQPIQLSFTVSDTIPFTVQWSFNGVVIPNATNALLALPNAQLTNNGLYTLTVTEAPYHASVSVYLSVIRFPSYLAGWGGLNGEQNGFPTYLNDTNNTTNGAVAIDVGYSHSLALSANGTVVAWGNNSSGQTNVPPNLISNGVGMVAVSVGSARSLALSANGSVISWGDTSFGGTAAQPNLTSIRAISAGGSHNLALRIDGTVVAWGKNDFGEINVPTNLAKVVAISAGEYHSVALLSSGTVVGWGYNSSGQTTPPPGLNNVVAISAGGFHTLALKADGTVVAWGENVYGQTNVPANLAGVVMISAKGESSMALKADGTVVAWGGLLGLPVPSTVTNAFDIATGVFYNAVLTRNLSLPSASAFKAKFMNGDFMLELTDTSYRTFFLYASDDLKSWQPILTNTLIPGTITFTDPGATNRTQRFYRVDIP